MTHRPPKTPVGSESPAASPSPHTGESMTSSTLVMTRALRWFAFAMMPMSCVLFGLSLTDRLAWMDALMAWMALLAITATFLFATLIDLSRLLRFVQDLSLGSNPSTPEIHTNGVAATAAFALLQIRREMRRSLSSAASVVESHERVFDALPDAIVLLNAGHQIVRANMAARNLFGRSLLGRDISSLVRHPPVLSALDSLNPQGHELEFTLPIPVERRFAVSIRPLAGEITGNAEILISFHDITPIRRIEQMRADFVANASHELRTPLSSLIGFIDTLRGPARDDQEAHDRFLGIMAEQAARMARLIEDLLSLSRIELNEHTAPSQKVEVLRHITSVVEALEPKAQSRNISVTIAAPDALPPVRGEPDELTQIFQNLIDNAIKYTLDATEVAISVALLEHGPVAMPKASQGRVIAVAVRDHGEGIPQNHIPRLTERFYRVDSARSRKMGGTGLGLAIVKHVMNRHRGVLTIDSTLGKGSIFTVYLPVADDTPEPIDVESQAQNLKSFSL